MPEIARFDLAVVTGAVTLLSATAIVATIAVDRATLHAVNRRRPPSAGFTAEHTGFDTPLSWRASWGL